MVRTAFRFLARERELDALRRRLEATAAGSGGVVALSGPPGIGTTTLAREVAARARGLGMAVAWGECREGLLDRPFGALAEALEAHALTLPPTQVMEDLATDGGPILHICPGLGAVLPTLAPQVPLEPVDERLRLREATFGWLTRMASRAPLLVVLDEFQLADGDLRGTVEQLARRLRQVPVLLLCVSSAIVTKGRKRAVKPRGALEALELDGLDLGAVAALLGGVSDRPVMPATVELVHKVAHGNPLLSGELYRHLVEEALLPGPGSSSLPHPSALPRTIAQVVAWRVARLPTPSRAALNVLAAFSRGAASHVVASVAGLVKARAIEALEILVSDALVAADERGARYWVIQPMIRAALLEAITPLLRAQMHRRIAEVIEAEAGDERRQIAGELAFHWGASRALPGRERGLNHFLLATEQARAAYAHLRAVDCLRAALTVAPANGATVFDLSSRLAMAEAAAGLRKEALASAHRVLELGSAASQAHAADRDAPSNEAMSTVIDTLRTLRGDGVEPGEWEELDALRQAALATLGADRSPRAESLPHARLHLLAEAWQPLTLRGAALLTWGDLQPLAAQTLARLGAEADRADQMLIQWPRTRADTAAAAEAANTWRRPQQTLRALACTVSDLVTRQGMFGEGVGWASQYLVTAERYGSIRDRVRALALLARCHTALGSFAGAEEALARADALLPALNGTPSPSAEMLADEVTISRFAMAYSVDGNWRALLKSLPPPAPPRPSGLLLAAQRCLGQWRAGGDAEARESVAALLDAAAELPPLTLHRDAALVAILAAAWEMGAAEHAAAGLSLARLARGAGVGAQIEGTLELTEARLLGLAGRVTESRAAFAVARAQMAAAGLRPLLALADHDEAIVIAAASSRGHEEAIQLLGSAGEKFERLGMRGWSDRVSDLTRSGLDAAAMPGGQLAFTYQRGLSRPEADLVRLLAGGATPAEAGDELGLDQPGVDRLLRAALKKLRGKSADELPQLARRYGLGGL